MPRLACSLALLATVAALATGCLSWRDLPVESERSRCLRGGARWVEPPNSIPICEHQSPSFM